MDGWVGGKTGLRIAYRNQKIVGSASKSALKILYQVIGDIFTNWLDDKHNVLRQ